MRVTILHDELPPNARPDELDALVQADVVADALRELGHEPTRLGMTLNLQRTAESLKELRPDCVFNLVESVASQGRLIYLATALLDSLGLPYTGAGTEAMFVTSCKTLCKKTLATQGVSTLPSFTGSEPDDAVGPVAGRYIIKSVWEEASVGLDDDSVQEFASFAQLRAALNARRSQLGGSAFAEPYVEGREFNLSLLGGADGIQVLPPAEIRFVGYPADKPRIVGYRAKWDEQSPEYHNTPRTFDFDDADRALLGNLTQMAERCWHVLGLRGYARVDFRVDSRYCPFVIEVNANPCLSPDAGFIAAARRAGLSMVEVVRRLIQQAMTSGRSLT